MARKKSFIKRHGLSIVSGAIQGLWIILYAFSDEHKHWGAFFGNAIADSSRVVVMVLGCRSWKKLCAKLSAVGTPVFFLNSARVDGLQEERVFEDIISAQLAAGGTAAARQGR